jgi:hypothetical protein
MKRHPFDITSFIFGAVLGAAAVGFLLADQLSWEVDGRWVLPAALIVLGIAGIAGAVSGLRPSGPAAPDELEDAHSDTTGETAELAETGSDLRSP